MRKKKKKNRYCPGGPDSDFEYSTQSYTGYEPTSMRAIRARYNPMMQSKSRTDQLKSLGHSVDKVKLSLKKNNCSKLMEINFFFRLNILLWEELLCHFLKIIEIILFVTFMMLYLDTPVLMLMKLLGIQFNSKFVNFSCIYFLFL